MGVSPEVSGKAASRPVGRTDYRVLTDDAPDLNTVVDSVGIFRYVSQSCGRLFGWIPEELEGRPEVDFVHTADRASLRAGRAALNDVEVASTSFRFLCRDGSDRWTETTSRRVEAYGSAWVVSAMRDLTGVHAHTMNLERLASVDPLTGVANRTVLMDRLHQGLRRLSRGDGQLAVFYLDLDKFKIVNDSLGHRVGDTVLMEMASRLVNHIRPADTVARLGGDEFVIVAEDLADEAAAVELANRIVAAGRRPFRVGEEDYVCTLSVGMALTGDSQRSGDDLLGEADLALYRAKERGRDRAEAFDEELRTRAVGRLVTERMLRQALADQRIVVEYQPIIDLAQGRAVGAEALIRINDPDQGLLLPQSFLEVAQETGLLMGMDEHVLADAIEQASGWNTRLTGTGYSEVAVNVTARHLADVGFYQTVLDQLDARHVAHGSLQIEVTERVLLEASNSAMNGLRALRDAGVQVGLDDFGTGYSSLVYLRQFPLDFIKIDRAFIEELEHDSREQAVVSAIIALAHALDLTVVAEGVETATQLQILQNLDCDRAQGFLFGKSAPPSAIDTLLNAPQQANLADILVEKGV